MRNVTKICYLAYRQGLMPSRAILIRLGSAQPRLIFYLLASTLFFLTVSNCPVKAATYYCDPVNGNTVTGNGSSEHPWGTLMSATKAGKFNGVMRCRHTCM